MAEYEFFTDLEEINGKPILPSAVEVKPKNENEGKGELWKYLMFHDGHKVKRVSS